MKFLVLAVVMLWGCEETNKSAAAALQTPSFSNYSDLVKLFSKWRNFESPEFKDGAPDYTKAAFKKRYTEFKSLQNRLRQADTTDWIIPEQVDYMIVWAEMNGYDFNHRILKP